MASLAEIMVSFVGTVPMSLRSAVHRGLEFYGYLPPVATPEARSQSGPFEYRQTALLSEEKGWMDACMDAQMNGWMDRWMDGWMD